MRLASKGMRITLLAVAMATVALVAFLSLQSDAPVIDDADVLPPGRWHFQSARLAAEGDERELARVLSLPYVAGKAPAPHHTGVILHDSEYAFEGLNLYVSGHGPEARLVDMQGGTVHQWEYAFERAFPELRPTPDTSYFRRAHLFPDGELLAIFQGAGLIRLDRDSRLLWSSDLAYFNHLYVAADDRIFAIAKRAESASGLGDHETVLEDSVVVLGPDGQVLDRISLLQCFLDSPFAGLLHPLPQHADIFHTNAVELVQSPPPDDSYPFREGDLLVSLREVDVVAFVDPLARTVRSAWRGPWRAQHQPLLLPTGRMLVFDNRGMEGASRVIEFDLLSSEITWQYSGNESSRLASPEAGSCQPLPNGNILITDSEKGRAVEITSQGRTVWEFVSPHRAGLRGELVATLFDLGRVPRSSLTFVNQP